MSDNVYDKNKYEKLCVWNKYPDKCESFHSLYIYTNWDENKREYKFKLNLLFDCIVAGQYETGN